MFAVGNESATGRATMSEMAPKQRHPPGPPMTLGNMRELGVDVQPSGSAAQLHKQRATPFGVAHRFLAIAGANGR
jgi:hypothetical protein